MSTCLRTRRVTHLTPDDARVEMRYQVWNFRRLFGVTDLIWDITREKWFLWAGISGLPGARKRGGGRVLGGLHLLIVGWGCWSPTPAPLPTPWPPI